MPILPSDHDSLITLSAQLDSACTMIKSSQKTMTAFMDKIDVRCELRKDEFILLQDANMKSSSFWKILTILVVVLMAMFGIIGFNRTIAMQNEIHIQHNTKLIEKNGQMLNRILNDFMPRNYNKIE